MKIIKKNKNGGFTDLFLFMIFAFVIILVSGVMIFIGLETKDQLHESMKDMDIHDTLGNNGSQVIDNTIGATNRSFNSLYWISIFLIGGMILAIFIGSYKVTTQPVYFIPYIFITLIAIVVSVGISLAYEQMITGNDLSSVFNKFVGSNFIMANLPIWITIIGIGGAIIMFSRMGSQREANYYGY